MQDFRPALLKVFRCAILFAAVAVFATPADAQRTRTPKDSGRQLTAICKKAGYNKGGYRNCAVKITAMCRKKGINPKSRRCWQWLLSQNDRRSLDVKSLRR